MACSYQAKFLIALFLFLFAKGDFEPYCYWIFTKDRLSALTNGIPSETNGWNPFAWTDGENDLKGALSCSSLTMDNYTWELQADARYLANDPMQYAVGFWINFQSTIGDGFLYFGFDVDVSFRVSSSTEGELIIKAYVGESTTVSSDDLYVNVPISNFHIDGWIFLVFHFSNFNSGRVDEMIYVPGHAAYTKSAMQSGFRLPKPFTKFGKNVKAKFYEVLFIRSSEMDDDLLTIYLDDLSGPFAFTKPCTGDCPDAQCTYDGQCVSKRELCEACSEGSCTSCSDISLDPDTYCNSCSTGYTLKNGKCNFYLGCADANNCIACSISSTICDSCPTGYFLYKATSSTSCICNFYLACDDSCTDCSPDPDCFNCAELVVESGDICKVESVGFQIAFDTPNIVFDFAYPLSSDLTKNLIKATTIGGADIPTTTWTFTDCTAGSVQCIIGTDLEENDIPIIIDFDFAQA